MPINERTTLLNAVTNTVTGTGTDLYKAYSVFTFNKTIVGVFAALVVNYEGSFDGVNWFALGTDNTLTPLATFVVDKPCRWVRAVVATFTGGTSVSVDVLPV